VWPAAALFSTLGRTAARGLESALWWRDWGIEFYDQPDCNNIRNGDTRMAVMEKCQTRTSGPNAHKAWAMTEAPRGALGTLDRDRG
jgi:hydrogenase large subunit